MFTEIAAWNAKQSLVVAGVLSGTSADGIDVGLARFARHGAGAPEPLAFQTVPFPAPLAAELRAVLDGGAVSVPQLGRLHRDLGIAFGEAVAQVAAHAQLQVDLVGSHGQTLWHFDGEGSPGTWQLGEGHHIAARVGAPCVCDFRSAHVAAGGHGAPLAILGDRRIFRALPLPAVVLNLGGMGNLSVWGEDPAEDLAWDTGPAGAWLDGLARRLYGAPMDRGGRWAAAGQAQDPWVAHLLEHPFFAQDLPRSTGRDTFGEANLQAYLDAAGAGARREDLLASAVEAIAVSVADSLQRFAPPGWTEVWVAGGGVHHKPLLEALETRVGRPVRSTAEIGIDPDMREALLFACLAMDFVTERWSPVAGTSRRALLGKWCSAPG